jgi:AbrB family looped-hinge helix DNA binding protein
MSSSHETTYTTTVDAMGRVLIPLDVRESHHINKGDKITFYVNDEAIRLRTAKHGLMALKHLVKKHVPKGVNLAEDLIKERRNEAQS